MWPKTDCETAANDFVAAFDATSQGIGLYLCSHIHPGYLREFPTLEHQSYSFYAFVVASLQRIAIF